MPRCISCGQRAQGAVLLQEESASATATPWWQSSTAGSGQIPTPPQVREEMNRVEAERRATAEREAETARRRAETMRKAAEARERLAAAKQQAAASVASVAASCNRCGVPVEEGFSFCLRCGADAPGRPVAGVGTTARTIEEFVAEKNEAAVRVAQATPGQTHTHVGVAVTTRTETHATPGLPALLSFFLPGIGQMVNGQVAKGVLLLLATFAALVVFGLPSMGVAMLVGRVLSAVDAYRIAERRRSGQAVRDGEWDLG